MAVADHRDQPRVAHVLDQGLRAAVRRGRVVGRGDHQRRVRARRDLPGPVVAPVGRDREDPVVELDVAVVEPEVVERVVGRLAEPEVPVDVVAVVLLDGPDQEVPVAVGGVGVGRRVIAEGAVGVHPDADPLPLTASASSWAMYGDQYSLRYRL